MKFAFYISSLFAHASSILLLGFSIPVIAQIPAFNNSPVRTELSQLQVSLQAPQLTTADILKLIAKIEVEQALSLAKFNPQHPGIKHFDTKLQDLYTQINSAQPQPTEDTAKSMISNAAYRKMEDLKIERSQLIKKFRPKHPGIVIIDRKIKQLEELIRRQRV
ncbi:MAG: hypothetical protein AAF378_06940 [Cyanobacteria bacterium P01_A01_bin.84]